MPNLPAGKKSLRSDKKKHLQNQKIKTRLKTFVKKLNSLIEQKNKEQAVLQLKKVISALDKATKTGIIKKNNASRNKSRLTSKVFKLK